MRRWLDALRQDLRYGIRLLWRNPGFATATILTIALGIGATTAVFTVVYGVVLKPLPYRDPERLVNIWSGAVRFGLPRAFVGAANYRDWAAQSQSFESMALIRHIGNFNVSGSGEPERLQGARVTASLFTVLQTQPALGRPFRVDEETPGHHLVVILSDGLWTRQFGRDPQVIGRTIVLNSEPHQIVGVMPPGFTFPAREFELWVPLTIDPEELRTRLGYNFMCIGRLRPQISVAQAQAEMSAISARLEQQYPASNQGITAAVEPMRADLARDVRRPLLTLLAAVASLLLIGCASVANLLIARAVARSGELVLRSALGAGRGRLVRQSLTELMPLLAVGGVMGLLVARVLLQLAVPWLPSNMPRLEAVTVGWPVLLFAAAMLVLTAVATAVWPALQVARWDVAAALRESLRGAATTLRGSRIRDGLVIAQISITLLLTISAALLTRTFVNLRSIDPGFKTQGVSTMHLAIPRAKYPQDQQVAALCRDIVQRVRRLPGVRAAGLVNRLPLGGVAQTIGVELDRSAIPNNVVPSIDSRSVSPEYFSALGIPVIEGRGFTDADGADRLVVGLVDERLARMAWPNESAIGHRFRIPFPDQPWVTIVGVVGHIRHDGFTMDPRPQVYWSYLQRAQDRMALVVRTDGDSAALVRPIIAEIRAADPEQAVYDVRTMAAIVDRATGQQRLTAAVVAAFAIVALLMSAIGVYGVISYGVRMRGREFGLRMALGAARRDVLLMVVRRGVLLVGCGVAVGLAAALLMTRALAGLLYGVSHTDVTSFAVAAILLAIAALAATIIPARRAVRVEPMSVLRGE